MKLEELKKETFLIFSELREISIKENKKIILCFSGGKDSHCLYSLYIEWCETFNTSIPDLQIDFSDTRLESQKLLDLVESVKIFSYERGIFLMFPHLKKLNLFGFCYSD